MRREIKNVAESGIEHAFLRIRYPMRHPAPDAPPNALPENESEIRSLTPFSDSFRYQAYKALVGMPHCSQYSDA